MTALFDVEGTNLEVSGTTLWFRQTRTFKRGEEVAE